MEWILSVYCRRQRCCQCEGEQRSQCHGTVNFKCLLWVIFTTNQKHVVFMIAITVVKVSFGWHNSGCKIITRCLHLVQCNRICDYFWCKFYFILFARYFYLRQVRVQCWFAEEHQMPLVISYQTSPLCCQKSLHSMLELILSSHMYPTQLARWPCKIHSIWTPDVIVTTYL